jgi:hypothetical protein
VRLVLARERFRWAMIAQWRATIARLSETRLTAVSGEASVLSQSRTPPVQQIPPHAQVEVGVAQHQCHISEYGSALVHRTLLPVLPAGCVASYAMVTLPWTNA